MHTRNDKGQYDSADERHRLLEEDRLENVVGCKITSRELRQLSIMFDQNRKIFGWQTQSDMFRDMLREGLKQFIARLSNPSTELLQMEAETEQMELASKEAARHLHHERAVEYTAERLEVLKRNSDYGGIRRLLQDFHDRTRKMKDPMIRRRRQEEFERRKWDKQLRELCKGMSLVDLDDEQ